MQPSFLKAPYLQYLEQQAETFYDDPMLYDYEYRNRKADVRFYIEELKGKPKSILELGCGTGRLLIPLAKQGHELTGVDLSAVFLQACEEKLKKIKKTATLVRANFLQLPPKLPQFDVVLCPFHSMMHLYDRESVALFLQEVHKHLKSDGVFIFDVSLPDIDWLNRDSEKRWSKTRFTHPVTKTPFIYSTNHIYDPVYQINWIRIYYDSLEKTVPSSVTHLIQRQFFPAELEALLFYNGFEMIQRYGDFDRSPLSVSSDEQIIVARKKS